MAAELDNDRLRQRSGMSPAEDAWAQLDLTINFTPPVYWIYPGERRPVVVKADTELEAIRKVRENPNYDGFGAKIYRVEEFAEICQLA